ncbi:hypothetical protein LXL04_038023 [Taraxacum kok-saghyz]
MIPCLGPFPHIIWLRKISLSRRDIAQILEMEIISVNHDNEFTFLAKIVQIDHGSGWCYASCSKCNKNLDAIDVANDLLETLSRHWSRLPRITGGLFIDDLIKRGVDPGWSTVDTTKYEVIIRGYFWALWRNRNDKFFNNSHSSSLIASEVLSNAFLWLNEREKRETVRRSAERDRKPTETWAARMKKAAVADSKVSSPLKNDNLGGKATTFFFTNFPEQWNEDKLWQEFRRSGTVVDVFVARKRNRVGRKFGFVRFLKVTDIAKKESELNNLWLDKFKLKANLAKYGRKEERADPSYQQKLKSVIVGQAKQQGEKPGTCEEQPGRSERTYAAMVNGPKTQQPLTQHPLNPVPPRMEAAEDMERNVIQVIPTPELVENLNNSLLGEVHTYSLLNNLHEFATIEGLNDVKICYIGGLNITIEFSSKVAAKNYLYLAKSTWKNWFRILKSWSPEDLVMKRLVSLTIIGIPPHAWNPSTFSDIGAIWGETVTIIIDNNRFKILVMEDPIESENLSPILSYHMASSDNEFTEEKEENSKDSHYDENSEFDFAGEDNFGHGMAGMYKKDDGIFGISTVERITPEKTNGCHTASLPVPCKCRVKIKNNGAICKHAIHSGNVKQSPILVERKEDEGSDSEIFIRSSNLHIMKSEAPVNPIRSTEVLIADEVAKLNSVGAKIGVDLEGYQDQLKNMETKSDKLGDFDVKTLWGSCPYRWAASPSTGNSGGLISIWDPNFVDIITSDITRNTVISRGTWKDNNQPMGIVNVYAPQDDQGKQDLWNYITGVIDNDRTRMWIICGDFNEVRCSEERRGSTFHARGAQAFNNFIENLGLIDLNLGGRSFTYVSPNGANSSRLDRILVSQDCISKWHNVSIIALPRLFSDHCPILLESNGPDFGACPFKFYSSWISEPSCAKVVEYSWLKNGPTMSIHSKTEIPARKLRILKEDLKKWRKETNNAKAADCERLSKCITEIYTIAEVLPIDEQTIKERCDAVLSVQELEAAGVLDLNQKSRCKWISDGDENSAYFHGLINAKTKRNRISGLNKDGIWISNPDAIKRECKRFFMDKFKDPLPVRPSIDSDKFLKLNNADRCFLELPFHPEEIKAAMWLCWSEKAPGPDGFNFRFFKQFWDILGKDVVEAVQFFGDHKTLNGGCNSSFITLVPKIANPLNLPDFRPINLIGCITKIISKTLAERLKTVIGKVVGKEQLGFIRGRSITERTRIYFD